MSPPLAHPMAFVYATFRLKNKFETAYVFDFFRDGRYTHWSNRPKPNLINYAPTPHPITHPVERITEKFLPFRFQSSSKRKSDLHYGNNAVCLHCVEIFVLLLFFFLRTWETNYVFLMNCEQLWSFIFQLFFKQKSKLWADAETLFLSRSTMTIISYHFIMAALKCSYHVLQINAIGHHFVRLKVKNCRLSC